MKIIIKTESEVLETYELQHNVTYEQGKAVQRDIGLRYSNLNCIKYEIDVEDGILLKDCDFNNGLSMGVVKQITVTIKQ